jgi:hypothetical protein
MTAAVNIECDFYMHGWFVVGSTYTCKLRVDPSITLAGVTVTSATGTQRRSMSEVQGFYSNDKTVNFMPRGLVDVFPNLIFVSITGAGMKELHQSDLKEFPRLKNLHLYNNAITIVEQGLFKFNTELEYIRLDYNKITQIHPTVFDHLCKLNYLYLWKNECINADADDRSAVLNLISRVKQECGEQSKNVQNAKLTTVKPNVENLQKTQEDEIKQLREDLNAVLSMAKEMNAKHECALLTMQKQGEEINTLKAENEVLKEAKAEVEDLKVKVAASESDRKSFCNELTALVAQETGTREANITAVVDLYKSIKAQHDTAVKAIDEKNTKIENNKLRLELMQSKLELKDEKFENLGRKVDGQGEKIDECASQLVVFEAAFRKFISSLDKALDGDNNKQE